MVRKGEDDILNEWLIEAEDGLLASFAKDLRADKLAIMAALHEPWSNGQTEGQINKLKTLKLQVYGSVNLDLLEARFVFSA